MIPELWNAANQSIFWNVNRLTRQEQLVLAVVLVLLLTGWAVKYYRAAHPPGSAVPMANS